MDKDNYFFVFEVVLFKDGGKWIRLYCIWNLYEVLVVMDFNDYFVLDLVNLVCLLSIVWVW